MHLAESAKPMTLMRRELQGLLPLPGRGIDVGAGKSDAPKDWRWWERAGMECDPWDLEQGDAHYLKGVADGQYDWLFSSHCLEHLKDPNLALDNWVRVVRPGGRLLISVPHRTLYEGRTRLPSKWNPAGHLRYYLPFEDDPPHTVGLYDWLHSRIAAGVPIELLNLVTGDWGNTNAGSNAHPNGEYQIDCLLERVE